MHFLGHFTANFLLEGKSFLIVWEFILWWELAYCTDNGGKGKVQ